MQQTSAVLVCEGACNQGRVQHYDAAVAAASRIEVNDRQAISGISENWLRVARAFIYTRHWYSAGATYQCTICGAYRRYGSNRPPPGTPPSRGCERNPEIL